MLLTGGLDVEEVGRIVGKRPGTVRHLQRRCLQRIPIGPMLEAIAE
jgi:hypothetical protein